MKKKYKGLPFKEDEESSNYAQFIITKQPDKKIKTIRLLLIIAYILFAIAYCYVFLSLVKIPYVIAILPGLIILLWFFTWKHTNIEYCYISTKGNFYVYKINGYGKAKEIISYSLDTCLKILPANDDFTSDIANYHIDEYNDYSSSILCGDRYISIWKRDNKTIGIYFDASNKLLSSLNYYTKDKVVLTYVSR